MNPLETDAIAALDEALTHPDPDPDELPAIPPGWHPASQQAAESLCMTILKGDAQVERLAAKARERIRQWTDLVRAEEARVEERRQALLAFLLKHNAKLHTPWFTAFPMRHKTEKIVMHDEERAISVCKVNGWPSAIRTKEEIVKAEFDAFFNAAPEEFEAKAADGKPIAESVPREPSLVIKPTAAGTRALEEAP